MSEQSSLRNPDNAQAPRKGGRRPDGKAERGGRDLSKLLELGREKIADRRWKDAASVLKRVVTAERNNGPALANLALAYQQQRKFNDAAKTMKRALEAAPMDPEVHVINGRLLHGYGEMDKAANAYTHALQLDP